MNSNWLQRKNTLKIINESTSRKNISVKFNVRFMNELQSGIDAIHTLISILSHNQSWDISLSQSHGSNISKYIYIYTNLENLQSLTNDL